MKRMFTLVAVVTAAALGVAGCSSDAQPEEEPVAEEVSAAPVEAVEEETDAPEGTDLSTVDACLALMEPLQEANLAMQELAQEDTEDPETAIAMWRTLSETFEEFGETASDPEMAALSTEVGEHGHALTDVMEKLYLEEDLSAMNEFSAANTAFFDSYQELLGLCNATP